LIEPSVKARLRLFTLIAFLWMKLAGLQFTFKKQQLYFQSF